MSGEKGSTAAKLANFLFAYRSAPHSTTGQSPAMLFLGRNLRSRLDILKPNVRRHVNNKQMDQTASHTSANITRITSFTLVKLFLFATTEAIKNGYLVWYMLALDLCPMKFVSVQT